MPWDAVWQTLATVSLDNPVTSAILATDSFGPSPPSVPWHISTAHASFVCNVCEALAVLGIPNLLIKDHRANERESRPGSRKRVGNSQYLFLLTENLWGTFWAAVCTVGFDSWCILKSIFHRIGSGFGLNRYDRSIAMRDMAKCCRKNRFLGLRTGVGIKMMLRSESDVVTGRNRNPLCLCSADEVFYASILISQPFMDEASFGLMQSLL